MTGLYGPYVELNMGKRRKIWRPLLEVTRGHLENPQRVLYRSLIGLNIRTLDYADVMCIKIERKTFFSDSSISEATTFFYYLEAIT